MDNKNDSNLIFIDYDFLDTENAKRIRKENTIGYVRDFYTKHNILRKIHNEPEMFAQLTDDETLTMYSWDRGRIERIDCLRHGLNYAQFVLLTKNHFNRDHFLIMCKLKGLFRYDILFYDCDESLPERIKDYMSENTEYDKFAVVSRIDLRSYFPDHAVWIRTEKIDFEAVNSRLFRYLCCEPAEYFSWYTERMDREDDDVIPFYKVIFLDVDGVLNDEGDEYSKGIIIDKNMVKRLGKIVEATDADVILSSSWKRGYKTFVKNGFKAEKNYEEFSNLYESLKAEGIIIQGITPISSESGVRARPFEIREWLMKYHRIFSYVILEDDHFWDWGFLQRNVVSTVTIDQSRDEYHQLVKGLTDEHVKKAIAILNERSAFPYYWKE